jgi:hypothetical protein
MYYDINNYIGCTIPVICVTEYIDYVNEIRFVKGSIQDATLVNGFSLPLHWEIDDQMVYPLEHFIPLAEWRSNQIDIILDGPNIIN